MSRDTNNPVAGSGRDGGKDAGRIAAIDMLMLDIVHDKFRAAVKEAIFGLEFLQENHLDPLAAAKEIPESFRAVYADMSKRADDMLKALYAHTAFTVDRDALPEYATSQEWCGDIEPEDLPAITRVVEKTNAAAANLRATLREMGPRLSTLRPAIVAWDNSVEIRMTVEFRSIRGRRCYAGDDNREAVELVMHPPLHEYLLPEEDRREVLDWNLFRFQDPHPLKNLFFDYLVHCLIEHGSIPLRVLPIVNDLWFEVSVRGDGHAFRNPNDEGPPSKLPFGSATGNGNGSTQVQCAR